MPHVTVAKPRPHVALVTMNRPERMNALSFDLVVPLVESLRAVAADNDAWVVVLTGAGRGFCSGGDVAFLRNSALTDNGVSGTKFFHDEYQLNHLMFEYAKPIVAFIDGITMGGGVGISQPAKFRVSTENTRFAMPETGIGLFPDVGGGCEGGAPPSCQ